MLIKLTLSYVFVNWYVHFHRHVSRFTCVKFQTNLTRFRWIIAIYLGVHFFSGHSVEVLGSQPNQRTKNSFSCKHENNSDIRYPSKESWSGSRGVWIRKFTGYTHILCYQFGDRLTRKGTQSKILAIRLVYTGLQKARSGLWNIILDTGGQSSRVSAR